MRLPFCHTRWRERGETRAKSAQHRFSWDPFSVTSWRRFGSRPEFAIRQSPARSHQPATSASFETSVTVESLGEFAKVLRGPMQLTNVLSSAELPADRK